MRKSPSLALRLILSFSLVTTLGFMIVGWITQASLQKHFETEDASELRVIEKSLENILAGHDPERDADLLERRLNDILVGHHHALLKIVNHGRVIFMSPALQGMTLPAAGERAGNDIVATSDGHHRYRLLSKTLRPGGDAARVYQVVIAVAYDSHDRFLGSFQKTLWAIVLGGIIIFSFLGWLIVRQGLSPLLRIVENIRHINAHKLQQRLDPRDFPEELRDLADSFNDMIERIDESFQRISNFSSDIAHELRTPITNMMTQTQVALSRAREVNEYREILYSNIDEYERMARMINDMLLLAKSDVGLESMEFTEVALHLEVASLIEFYEAWAEEAGVTLRMSGQAQVAGDQLMLRRALSNLLSNAIHHTPRGGGVDIMISDETADVVVEIRNRGETIAPESLPRLFDRFYHRSHPQGGNPKGFGLGLAIVKSIVDAHGGHIGVVSENSFTTFSIRLPAAPRQSTGH